MTRNISKASQSVSSQCPFCNCADEMIGESEFGYIKWDNFPVNPGHVLVIAKRHFSNYFECTQNERNGLWEMVEEAKQIIEKSHSPDGYNIGINVGESAGQTVSHLHIHIIPRYVGDVQDPRGGVRGVIASKQKY